MKLLHVIYLFVLSTNSYVNIPQELKVRAGEWDTKTTTERLPYQERNVFRIFSHPDYNDRSEAFDVVSIIVVS